MKAAEAKALFKTEAQLCEVFIRDMNAQAGWTCYPETAGFDILAVHESGRQIGIEAKLALNAKVADQILPEDYAARYDNQGPDHRAVIVPCLTESNYGISRMLRLLGVAVWEPHMGWTKNGERPEFSMEQNLRYDSYVGEGGRSCDLGLAHCLFDWNPTNRCDVPEHVPDVPAGVPAPVRWTPWKAGALRVLALLKTQGYITSKQIAAQGISPSIWTQTWLARAAERGQWVATDKTPWHHCDRHPVEYAAALAKVTAGEVLL